MRAKAIVEHALSETFLDEDEDEMELTVLSGLADEELAAAVAAIGAPLPAEIDELLRYTRGLEFGSFLVSFAPEFSFGMEEILPRVSPLCDDGYGNSWLIEIAPNGAFGPVFYACHDPPVLALQCADLGTFIDELFSMGRPDRRSQLDVVHEEATARLWRSDEDGTPARELASSRDPVIRAFVERLRPDDMVFDLRARRVGSGFDWERHGPRTRLLRHGAELLFAVGR